MLAISGKPVELTHYFGRVPEVGDRFEQRDNIDVQSVFLPAAQQEKRVDLHDMSGTLALADDVSLAALGAVLVLDKFDALDRSQRVLDEGVGNAFGIDSFFDIQDRGYPFRIGQEQIFRRQCTCFFGNGHKHLAVFGGLLADVQCGEVQAEYLYLIDQVFDKMNKKAVVVADYRFT
jgi:hypothetical protein